jgi:hypothetical protein
VANPPVGRPFTKGVSGNPAGRAKDVDRILLDRLRALKRAGSTREGVEVLADRLEELIFGNDPKVALAALKFWVERVGGRPREHLTIEAEPSVDADRLAALSTAHLEALATLDSPDESDPETAH